jgi:hypothetical protein
MQKYTLNDIKRAWNFCYGEDIKTEYTGFYLHLKNKTNRKDDRMIITKKDTENILDVLKEWFDIVEPKELEKNEIGLNFERYEKLIKKLTKKGQ